MHWCFEAGVLESPFELSLVFEFSKKLKIHFHPLISFGTGIHLAENFHLF